MISLTVPSRLDTPTFQRLIAQIKKLKTTFYLLKVPILVPYSYLPTPFILEVTSDLVGIPIEIIRNTQSLQVVIPTAELTTLYLRLESGYNRIQARSAAGETFELFVGATTYAALLQGIAHELYQNVEINITALENTVRSPWNPKLVEHLVPWFQDLPSSNAMRAQATRMSMRAAINEAGTTRGVMDFMASLSSQTPIAVRLRNDPSYYDPIINPLFSSPNEFSGSEFHIWIPNYCLAPWEATPKLVSNVEVYRLIDIRDKQIRLTYEGLDETHTLDSDAYGCSLANAIELQGCMYNIWSWVKLGIRLAWASCAYQYPFDVMVENPLGIRLLDSTTLDTYAYETTTGNVYPEMTAKVQEDNLFVEDVYIGDEFESPAVGFPTPPGPVEQIQIHGVKFSGSLDVSTSDLDLTDADFSVADQITSVAGGFLGVGIAGTKLLVSVLVEHAGYPKVDGDCNALPGSLISASSNFLGFNRKFLTIAGQLRKITTVTMLSAQYSGLPLAGVGVAFTVWNEYLLDATVVDDNSLSYEGEMITGVNRQISCRLWDESWNIVRTLDTVDPHDPLGDGWIGLALVHRHDSHRTLGPVIVGEGNGVQTTFSGTLDAPVGPGTLRVFLAGLAEYEDDPASSTFIPVVGWGDIRHSVTGVIYGAVEYATGRWVINTSPFVLPTAETLAFDYIKSPAYCYDTYVAPVTSLYSSTSACVDPFCGEGHATHLVGGDYITYCSRKGLVGKVMGTTQTIPRCNVPCCDGPSVSCYPEGYSNSFLALSTPVGVGLWP